MATRIAAFSILMAAVGAGCSKTVPALKTTDSATLQKDDQTTTDNFGRYACFKHGAQLEVKGVFDFPVDSTGSVFSGYLGGRAFGMYNWLEFLISNPPFGTFDVCNLSAEIVDKKFVLNATIYDMHGRLLFEVHDNKWRVYPEAVRKYNYDSNGFEIYDKENRIAISIDANPPWHTGSLFVQGIVPCTSTGLGFFSKAWATYDTDIPYGTPALNKAFDHYYDSLAIQPLFRYTGKDWQHARL